MSDVQLPGESLLDYRVRILEEHRGSDVALLNSVHDSQLLMKQSLDALVATTALKESRASTLRVTLLGVAAAAVLGGVVTVAINVATAASHLAISGTVPTP